MRQHGIRIGVGFQNPAPLAVATQTPIVAEGARFLLGARNHRLRNALELINLSFVDREIDGEAHSLLEHAQLLLCVAWCRAPADCTQAAFDGRLASVRSGWPTIRELLHGGSNRNVE